MNPGPWQPEWMLLSYGKTAFASSTAAGSSPALAVDENIRTWWSAVDATPGQWLAVDLGKSWTFGPSRSTGGPGRGGWTFPGEAYGDDRRERYIEVEPQISRYTMETSADGQTWETLEDGGAGVLQRIL